MAGFFWTAKPARPAVVPTDTVVPMHFFDDNAINRSVLLYLTLRFDDVLDPERLLRALERLMELGDWRKLGARVRMTVSRAGPHAGNGVRRSELTPRSCRMKASLSIISLPHSTQRDLGLATHMRSTTSASGTTPSRRVSLGRRRTRPSTPISAT